jgi:hypothetical protein
MRFNSEPETKHQPMEYHHKVLHVKKIFKTQPLAGKAMAAIL